MVVLGIDAHKRSHTVVVVDDTGRKLGERTSRKRNGRNPSEFWTRSPHARCVARARSNSD